MIKINLLPQKRAKRARVAAPGAAREPAGKDLAIGFGVLAGVAAVVFFAVDQPRRSRLHDLQASNDQLAQEIKAKNDQLKGYAEMQKAEQDVNERAGGINRLVAAKVVPANVLHELGEILTLGHQPTMTEHMTKLTGNGPESNPNKRFDVTWDPAHVWVTGYADKSGDFKIEGGAQSEADVTQLSLRLAASAYFANVAPSHEERVVDKETGVNYYKFTITGKVAY